MNADGIGHARVTSGPFDDREPSWSRDGNRIAFSSDRSGNYDIFDLDVASGAVRQLTHNPANDYAPAYSPVNSTIAFVSEREDRRGVWAVDAATALRRRCAAEPAPSARRRGAPTAPRVIYNVIADESQQPDLRRPGGHADEDVFPFRAQWMSPTEFIYTADGKIKKRDRCRRQTPRRSSSAPTCLVHAHAVQASQCTTSIRARARPVRGIMAPVISPDGTRGRVRRARRLVADADSVAPRRAADQRSLRRDGSDLVAGRPLDRVFVRSRRHDGSLGPRRSRAARISKVAPRRPKASWAPRGSEIAYIDRDGALAITGRPRARSRARCAMPGRPTWAPEGLIAVTDAAAVFDAVPRRHQPVAAWCRPPAAPIDGSNPVEHHSIGTREHDGPVWSRDGSKMAFVMDGVMHVMPTTPTGDVDRRAAPRSRTTWPTRRRGPRIRSGCCIRPPSGLKLVDVTDGRVTDVPINLTLARRRSRTGRIVVHAGRLFDGRHRVAAQQRRHRHSRQSHRAGRRASRRPSHRPRRSTPATTS